MNAISQLLQEQLNLIKIRNPRFSLRAFAKQLGISPATLSKVLNGKQLLTEQSFRQIAVHLKLEKKLTNQIVKSASFETKRHASRQSVADTKRSLDLFNLFAHWHHFAILEWIKIRKGFIDIDEVSIRFGLTAEKVRASLDLLVKHGFASVDPTTGLLRQTVSDRKFGDSVPSMAIREYHMQLIAKAQASINQEHYSKRNISSATISVSQKSYELMVSEIIKFRKRITKLANLEMNADRVYSLNIQLVPLSLESENEGFL